MGFDHVFCHIESQTRTLDGACRPVGASSSLEGSGGMGSRLRLNSPIFYHGDVKEKKCEFQKDASRADPKKEDDADQSSEARANIVEYFDRADYEQNAE